MSSDEERLARQMKLQQEAERYNRMGEVDFASRKDRIEAAKRARQQAKRQRRMTG